MFEENKMTTTMSSEITDGQSSIKSEESANGESSDKGAAFAANMKKKMSKVKSKFGANKSTMSMKRKRSEALPPSSLVDPIVVPVVTVTDLRERYYRDLRQLVPPPDLSLSLKWTQCLLFENLCLLHKAIDEMNQILDDFDLSRLAARRVTPDVGSDLVSCANLPQSDSLPKPDTGIKMKTYWLRTRRDRSTGQQHDDR